MLLLEQLTQLLNNMKRTLSFFLSITASFIFTFFLLGGGASAQGQCEGIISEDAQYVACCANDKDDSMSSCATYRTHVRYTLGRCNGTIPNDATYSLCCEGASSVAPNLNACLTYNTQKNAPSCTIITTDAQFTACCSGDSTNPTIENACDIYAATEANTPPPGGTQTTNPTGGTSGITTTGGSGATGAAVGECSAIRFRSLLDILIWIKCVISGVIVPLIFSLATLFFMWNLTMFIRSSDNSQKKEDARQRMVWGLIALFIMLSVWGIITILSNIFGISPTVPLLQTEVYLDPAKASKK